MPNLHEKATSKVTDLHEKATSQMPDLHEKASSVCQNLHKTERAFNTLYSKENQRCALF